MDKVKNFLKQYFVLVILLFLIVLFGMMSPDSFLTMTILNISEYYQLVIRGCIFLGAVCLDGIQKKLAGRKVKKVA